MDLLARATNAIRHGERSTAAWLRLAAALRAERRWPELEAAINAARAAATRAEEFAALGDLLTRLEDFGGSRAAYDQALSRNPDHPQWLFNRAAVRRYLGELEGAEQDYDRVIALNPRDSEAWHNRSELRAQTPQRNHIAALEGRLRHALHSPREEVPIRYALAKEYEDLGRYRESWRHLAAGAALRRQHLQYDVRIDIATVDWIIEAFPTAGDSSPGCPSGEPIFIVGMPRTGTTLLERILGGSPQVYPAGELGDLAAALVSAVHRKVGSTTLTRRDMVHAAATVDAAAVGYGYIDRTRPRTGRLPRFTDKLPLNYLYCGLIRRALPQSRLLHLTRHPLATCYSVFKVLFKQGYPFSYSLTEIAEYYVAYRRLMDHWQRIHPGMILDIAYERLVTDSAAEAQRVFGFCDLEWTESALAITERSAPSTTASAAQVRRPIYTSTLDLWQHYTDELAPVAERLRQAGIPL